MTTSFDQQVSEHIWRTKYQWCEGGHMQEPSIAATWDRVALAVSSPEVHHRDDWRERFRSILNDFRFLPGGRILANAGTTRRASLFNCFAMGPMEDSLQGIFNSLREAVVTQQVGGGVGIDFSTVRPSGASAVSSGSVASGPISFMKVWDAATAALESGNLRRGAMMATLRCDHPDIEAFIDAKISGEAFVHFTLSVAVTDDLMRAVEEDGPWPLLFPLGQHPIPAGGEVCERIWSGAMTPQLCLVHRRIPARALWEKLQAAMHASGEPGVLFMDRINRANNLWYCERIATTNPCGEVPLPPYGACNLGSINLGRFVLHPFGEHAKVDWAGLKAVAGIATRFLDNVHDIASFPLKAQERAAHASRRIGLGITGLADMFAMLGLRYGAPASIQLASQVMGTIRDMAYRTSVEIAQEKGAFPGFDKVRYGASPFVLDMPHDLQNAIAQHGIRNSHLLAVAPTGSISLLANNVSSGIEPIFAFQALRNVQGADGQPLTFEVSNAALRQYRQVYGKHAPVPPHFVQLQDVGVDAQLRMVAAVQMYVDSAISKTVWLPQSANAREIELVLLQAWELGLKGCTVYREGCAVGTSVIAAQQAERRQPEVTRVPSPNLFDK
jgi:ribonucleoside-diphosphate reductase alpha chain